MKTLFKKENLLSNLFLLFWFIFYFIYSIFDMFSSSQTYSDNSNRLVSKVFLVLIFFILAVYCCISFVRIFIKKEKLSKLKSLFFILIPYAIFLILYFILSVLSGLNSRNFSFFGSYLIYYSLGFLYICFFYLLLHDGVSRKLIVLISFLIIGLYFSVVSFFFVNVLTTPSKTGAQRFPQLAHPFAVIAPFLLIRFFGTKRQIIFSYILVIFLVVLSIKRSLIICFVIVALFELFFNFKGNKNKWKILFVSGISILILFFGVIFANELLGGRLLGKFTLSSFLSGSGRNEIWESTIKAYSTSSLKEKIFGNGVAAVNLTVTNGLGAHNDFLEFLFDFGFVGLLSFVVLSLFIFAIVFSFVKKTNIRSFRISSLSFIVFYAVLTMVSSIFLNTNITIFALLGCVLFEQNRKDENENKE